VGTKFKSMALFFIKMERTNSSVWGNLLILMFANVILIYSNSNFTNLVMLVTTYHLTNSIVANSFNTINQFFYFSISFRQIVTLCFLFTKSNYNGTSP